VVAYGSRRASCRRPGTPEQPATPSFHLIDNGHTLLRETALVVIDAMSTGCSRVVDGQDPNEWHGWSKDIELVSELIRLWVTRYGRWGSPLYLLGESYGTVRAVSVAQRLQDTFSMYLNGIILVSLVLDFGTQDFEDLAWDRACIGFLPTYAAIAHYHGNHLKLDDHTLDRIEEAFFDNGHMPYLGCREEEADGIATFIWTSQGAPKIDS